MKHKVPHARTHAHSVQTNRLLGMSVIDEYWWTDPKEKEVASPW